MRFTVYIKLNISKLKKKYLVYLFGWMMPDLSHDIFLFIMFFFYEYCNCLKLIRSKLRFLSFLT